METSLEFFQLNYELAKKINIRDLVRNKINNQKPAAKFADIDAQVENTIPKLTSVLCHLLSRGKFYNELKEMNEDS